MTQVGKRLLPMYGKLYVELDLLVLRSIIRGGSDSSAGINIIPNGSRRIIGTDSSVRGESRTIDCRNAARLRKLKTDFKLPKSFSEISEGLFGEILKCVWLARPNTRKAWLVMSTKKAMIAQKRGVSLATTTPDGT